MIGLLKNKISSLDIHTKEVLKKSISSSIVKVFGILAALVVSIILGRYLGAEGLGVINLANRIAGFLVIVSLFGMPNLIIKEVAIAKNKDNERHIGDCMKSAYLFNGLLATFLIVLVLILTPFLVKYVFKEPDLMFPLTISVIMVLPLVFSRIFSAGLIGFRKIWQSNLVNRTLSLWVITIILLVFLITNTEITISRVAIMYGIGGLVVVFSVGGYWRFLYKPKVKSKNIIRKLIKPASSIFIVNLSAVFMANIGVFILGWIKGVNDVGLYSVAIQVAMLTAFFLQVTNSSVSPKIAALYADNKINALENMLQKVTRGLLFLGIFITLIFVFFGKLILSLWGLEFVNAYLLLVILGLGQLVNLSTGAVGFVLIMTGFERVLSKISTTFIIVSIVLSYILISLYGVVGAAIATAVSMTLENITKVVFVKIKTGINILSITKYF